MTSGKQCYQSPSFLPLTERNEGSGDENATPRSAVPYACGHPYPGLEKNYDLNLPFEQASLKFHLPGQDFINCCFSLVHEQLVHRASEWGKSLVRHQNLLVPDDRTGLFSSPVISTGKWQPWTAVSFLLGLIRMEFKALCTHALYCRSVCKASL